MTDLDDTQPHATPVTPNVLSSPAPPSPESPAGAAGPAPGTAAPVISPAPGAAASPSPPPLQAAPPPENPSTWREPPWGPPREERRGPSPAAIIVGLIILAAGIYFFVDRTLGIDLPAIQWSNLWPILLVVVGALIIIRALGRAR